MAELFDLFLDQCDRVSLPSWYDRSMMLSLAKSTRGCGKHKKWRVTDEWVKEHYNTSTMPTLLKEVYSELYTRGGIDWTDWAAVAASDRKKSAVSDQSTIESYAADGKESCVPAR